MTSLSSPNTKDQNSTTNNNNNTLKASGQDKDKSLVKTDKLATANVQKTHKKTNHSSDAPQTSHSSQQQHHTSINESFLKVIKTREEFNQLMETIKDKYVLVWFSATWCGPCKTLAVIFNDLAQKYQNKVEILKVDVDILQDLALENDVSTMPSYMVMRNGQKLAHYSGNKQQQIDEIVEKYLKEKSV